MAINYQVTARLLVQGVSSYNRVFNKSGTLTTENGPTPGVVTAINTGTGTAISLAQMVTPSWGYFQNLDSTNWVEIGILVSATFYPLIRLAAGDGCVIPLSPNVNSGATLKVKSNAASVKVLCDLFDA
jgi:hypothetical protein